MKKIMSDQDRFWSRVSVGNRESCWAWPGTGGPHGYGVFRVGSLTDNSRRQVLAHRFAFETVAGPIPAGKSVLHSCDNPGCVNPSHLRLGSHQENMAEKVAKGRHRNGVTRGTANRSAKLSDEIVRTIRSSSASARSLAKAYGVTLQSLSAARKGKTWRHVDGLCQLHGAEGGGS